MPSSLVGKKKKPFSFNTADNNDIQEEVPNIGLNNENETISTDTIKPKFSAYEVN